MLKNKQNNTTILVIAALSTILLSCSIPSNALTNYSLIDKTTKEKDLEELPIIIPQIDIDPTPFLEPYLPTSPPLIAIIASQDYFVFEEYGGWWYDAEKTSDNTEDDLLCWAAAASNVMEYTGWGTVKNLVTTDDMFTHYQDHWIDKGGWMNYAWEWWFDNTTHTADPSSTNRVDVNGGGNYYPALNMYDYYHQEFNQTRTLSKASYYLHQGYPITLAIRPTTGNGGHAITCWGIRETILGGFQGIWVTDSDDNKGTPANPPPGPINTLRYYEVEYDYEQKRWEMTNYGGGWYIEAIMVIETIPTGLSGNRPTANAHGPYYGFTGSSITFTGSATDPDTDQILEYRWDFNADGFWDTTFSTSPTATHAYTSEYKGLALLEVFDGKFKDVDKVNVTVSTLSAVFDNVVYQLNPFFIVPTIHEINFTDFFIYIPFPNSPYYEWDFGDGTQIVTGSLSGDLNTVHHYSTPGEYQVVLKIKDEDSVIATYSSTIQVVTPEFATEILSQKIQNLDDSLFVNNPQQRKKAMNNMLVSIRTKISEQEYNEAIQALIQNIRQKTDGTIDGKTGNDWILDPEAQQELCLMIDDLVKYLHTLI